MSASQPNSGARRSGYHPRWLEVLRGTTFVVIALFMVYGPFHRQVIGERLPIFRQWTMFSLGGVGLADVKFSQRLDQGLQVPVDHYALLGYPDWRRAPLAQRRIIGLEGVRKVAVELCAVLGPGADLRARVRVATPLGWRTAMMEADQNLCESP